MRYEARAGMTLSGHQCVVCDAEIGPTDAIRIDEDCGGEFNLPRRRVFHDTCWRTTTQTRFDVLLDASNLAQLNGETVTARQLWEKAMRVLVELSEPVDAVDDRRFEHRPPTRYDGGESVV